MLYAKQFFASFFLVLGLGLIVIGIAGAGNTLLADWNPLGPPGDCIDHATCVAADACRNDPASNSSHLGDCDRTKTNCDACICGNTVQAPLATWKCIKEDD